MELAKTKILKIDFGSAKSTGLVAHSTRNVHSSMETTDITLYKLAQQYTELKRLVGTPNVYFKREYQLLCEEARQESSNVLSNKIQPRKS